MKYSWSNSLFVFVFFTSQKHMDHITGSYSARWSVFSAALEGTGWMRPSQAPTILNFSKKQKFTNRTVFFRVQRDKKEFPEHPIGLPSFEYISNKTLVYITIISHLCLFYPRTASEQPVFAYILLSVFSLQTSFDHHHAAISRSHCPNTDPRNMKCLSVAFV